MLSNFIPSAPPLNDREEQANRYTVRRDNTPVPPYTGRRDVAPTAPRQYDSGRQDQRNPNQTPIVGNRGFPNARPAPDFNGVHPQRQQQITANHADDEEDLEGMANMQIAGDNDNEDANYGATFEYDEEEPNAYGHFAIGTQTPTCRVCNKKYASRNKLMAHIRQGCYSCRRCDGVFSDLSVLRVHIQMCKPGNPPQVKVAKKEKDEVHVFTDKDIIRSRAPQTGDLSMGFRKWHYLEIRGGLSMDNLNLSMCVDYGANISMVDRAWLKKYLPKCNIKTMQAPVPVKGIGGARVDCYEFAPFDIYIPAYDSKGNQKLAVLSRGARVVDNLAANLLIAMDIIGEEVIDTLISKQQIVIWNCENGLFANAAFKPKAARIRYTVRAAETTVVQPGEARNVPIQVKGHLTDDLALQFSPLTVPRALHGAGVVAHLVDAQVNFVQARNYSTEPLLIKKGLPIGHIHDLDAVGYFSASQEDGILAVGETVEREDWIRPTISLQPGTLPNDSTASERKLDNGIMIYGTPEEHEALEGLVSEFDDIFQESDTTVDIPRDQWMSIPLKPNAKVEASKVYGLGAKDRAFLDNVYDDLHAKGKLQWPTDSTSHGYPVFVVWRTVHHAGKDPKRKGRVVVDIRGLNRITEVDAYPIPLQSDIITAMRGCKHISTTDAVGWFHQFSVKEEDRHKLTVVSHRGQEQYCVAPMGYKNSPPYVQRQTDQILRPHREYARAYIDDFVIHSKKFREHLQHLRNVFQTCRERRIHLQPKKTYLNFPNVNLLGKHVDSFGLSTADDKIAAILAFEFPKTLADLDRYLGLTGWMREYVEGYAHKAGPLQDRKTKLLSAGPRDGNERRRYTASTPVTEPTREEIAAFESIQEAFKGGLCLHHHDPELQAYCALDSSIERGIGAVYYHLKPPREGQDEHEMTPSRLQPILFLSKRLTTAETRYRATELEVAGLVWTVRRIRHLIGESLKLPVIIYTGHAAITSIVAKGTLHSSNVDRLNIRLVRASQYLSQFELDVRYKPGRQHTLPDAISRLASTAVSKHDGDEILALMATAAEHDNEEMAVFFAGTLVAQSSPSNVELCATAYHAEMVELADTEKKLIIEGYQLDPQWQTVWEVLHEDKELGEKYNLNESENGLKFALRDDLIYYIRDGATRLCLPESFEKKVFKLAHDDQAHAGHARSMAKLRESLYMAKLSRRMRKYIEHCPICNRYQTLRHQPYGKQVPIPAIDRLFHTVTLDFILALPESPEGFNVLLTMTDKYSKRVALIPGKDTWKAKDWAKALFDRLCIADWGFPKQIISDRDPKFTGTLWQALLSLIGVTLLMSTAYHPQTDGQSERTNQTIEIALRFMTADYPDVCWVDFLPSLTLKLQNMIHDTTDRSATEIMYGSKVSEGLDLLNVTTSTDRLGQRFEYRQEATEALDLAAIKAKAYYDAQHKRPISRPEDAF
jgi:Reverse transcriptase (RNA-dependent DNA polymerase)/RNase H-like domain found in reverse transcriptase/Integrase zinc binding domain